MSRNFKNNASSNTVQKFCKVCQDAGKPEAIYRSHFTRETKNPSSKVTCPTLLALECRYCYKNGHTVKYCSVLKEKERQKAHENAPARPVKSAEEVKVTKPNNPYACLDSDSEEEDQKVSIKPVESFPQLCAPVKKTVFASSNYAAALSCVKPAALSVAPAALSVAPAAPTVAHKLAPWVTRTESQASPVAAPLPPIVLKNPRRCWADDSDSDSEDEEQAAPVNLPKNFKLVVPVLDEDW